MSIVSSSGISVNNESTSKDDKCNEASKLCTSFANENELLTVHSLVVIGVRSGTINLDNLYVVVVDRIGLNFGLLLTTGLCTLGDPYRIPGRDPLGHRS